MILLGKQIQGKSGSEDQTEEAKSLPFITTNELFVKFGKTKENPVKKAGREVFGWRTLFSFL